MANKHQVDLLVRRVLLFSKLFTNSWGKPDTLAAVKHGLENYLQKGLAYKLYDGRVPRMVLTKEWQTDKVTCLDGHFQCPLVHHYPQMFPTHELGICRWRGHFVRDEARRKGLAIILAPTGDHTFTLREKSFAVNLLKEGISSILIENPFYGRRKPPDQFRSALLYVSDLFVMGAALIVECNVLLRWAYEQGHSPLGLTGVSLGGYMAGLAATNADIPVAVVPCLSWTSAAPVYTRGALADAINWEVLTKELNSHEFIDKIGQTGGSVWLDRLHNMPPPWPGLNSTKAFMWILMDQFTNLDQYPTPLRPELAHFVVAQHDAYIERDGAPHIHQLWPEAGVSTIPDVGHVLGFVQHQPLFRKTLLAMLDKASNQQVKEVNHL